MRDDLSRTLKIATVWLLLGAGIFLAFEWWQHEAAKSRFHAGGGVIEIRRAPDGHYHWAGHLNGRRVEFLVDTGASTVAIPEAMAQELGLSGDASVMSSTAGGLVRGRLVRADLSLEGGITVERLGIVALPALDDAVLGMDVLGRLRWEQHDGVLRVDLRAPGNNDR